MGQATSNYFGFGLRSSTSGWSHSEFFPFEPESSVGSFSITWAKFSNDWPSLLAGDTSAACYSWTAALLVFSRPLKQTIPVTAERIMTTTPRPAITAVGEDFSFLAADETYSDGSSTN